MSLSWLLSLSFSMQCWRQCPLPPAQPSAALGSSASPPSMRSTITKLIELSLSLRLLKKTQTFPYFYHFSDPYPRMHHYNHTLNSLGPEAHTRAWEGASDCASSLVWDAWIMTPPITITLLQQIIMSQKPSLSRDELNEQNSEIRRKLPPGGDRRSLSGRRLDLSFLSCRLWHYYFALVWCVWMIFMMLNVCGFTVASSLLQKQLPSDLSCSVLRSARLTIILHVQGRNNTRSADDCLCSVLLTRFWSCIYWLCGMFLLSLILFLKFVNILFKLAQFTSALYWTFCYGLFFCPAGSHSLKQTGFITEKKVRKPPKLGTSSLPAELNTLQLCLLSCP